MEYDISVDVCPCDHSPAIILSFFPFSLVRRTLAVLLVEMSSEQTMVDVLLHATVGLRSRETNPHHRHRGAESDDWTGGLRIVLKMKMSEWILSESCTDWQSKLRELFLLLSLSP